MTPRPRLPAEPDLTAFMTELETRRRSPHTVKNYALAVNRFRRWLADDRSQAQVALRSASAADLRQYHIHMVSHDRLSKNSLYMHIKALQAFYRFIGMNVADALSPPRRSQSLPKYLTEREASLLLEAADRRPRDHTIVLLLLYTGLRVGELVSLRTPDIDFEERTIRVRSGKGDKDRLVVAPADVLDVVRNWLARRPRSHDDFLFPGQGGRAHVSSVTVQRIIGATAQRAGIDKVVTPHVLRHTLATTLLRRGGDIRFIQRILGHASIATTQIYTHLDDAELKRMYDDASPHF